MLVLSRKAGESIVIGEFITVTVVNVGRGRVRIGVDAPTSVRISRADTVPASAWTASDDRSERPQPKSAVAAPVASGRSVISRRISPAM